MKKRGLSVVVASVLMIVLVMSAVIIVWGVVKNMIEGRTEEAQDCFNVEFGDKVMINEDYTCYNSTNESVHVSIGLSEEEIDGLLISIESAGASKTVILTHESQNLPDVKNYPQFSSGVKLPSSNAGLTYYFTGFTSVDAIKIAPQVGEYQCKVSDSVVQIEDCIVFTYT
jgi:hypothetical protein